MTTPNKALDGIPEILKEVNPISLPKASLVENDRSYAWITDKVCGIVEQKAHALWWALFLVSTILAGLTVFGLAYQVSTGVGVWGLSGSIYWGWAIVNFVFWIGIGHAGTLISAILCLLRQDWRTSVNRAAEAMTVFAVICAAIFPLFHVGRAWFVWFLLPVPTSQGLWPNFRSPLEWDVFAVATYGIVSVLFWYMGMIPDLSTLRDRAKTGFRKIAYGIMAMGWRSSGRHWNNYELAYLLMAGLSTALVLSVHSVISFDFAVSNMPGWHTTIFPPYFVAGAIFSGFAMVLTLIIPMRKAYGLGDLITQGHIDAMCKICLATGSMVGYAYGMEFFTAWYGGNLYEVWALKNRAFGSYWWAFLAMVTCNVFVPQLFWFKCVRRNMLLVWILAILINIGMWSERFVIVVSTLAHDYLPANWDYYSPTWVDKITFLGTFGIFGMLFLLFLRFMPSMAIGEIKAVTPQANPYEDFNKK